MPGMSAQPDFDAPLRTRQLPGIVGTQPLVRFLDLGTVDDLLTEHAELVADAIRKCRHVERGERVDETGGEAAEAAIPQCRLRLLAKQCLEIQAQMPHAAANLV